jgi:hypothetical protein
MPTSNQPIPVPATDSLDASLKAAALTTIAAHLDAGALGILAAAAKKHGAGASAKVKSFKAFL